MNTDINAINWFEIAVTDMARAARFYESAFETSLTQLEMMGMQMAMFPTDSASGKVGGALVKSDMHKPSASGTLVYLNANPDLQPVLGRIEKAGGIILMPKTLIDENTGYIAFFTDTEGNTIGLHSTR